MGFSVNTRDIQFSVVHEYHVHMTSWDLCHMHIYFTYNPAITSASSQDKLSTLKCRQRNVEFNREPDAQFPDRL